MKTILTLATLMLLGLSCATPPMDYSEFKSSDLQKRTLVYVSVRCAEDTQINLSPAVRGEGSVSIECEPGRVHRLSFPLGEGVYVLTGIVEERFSFRWVKNLFEVPEQRSGKVVYWGRISTTSIGRTSVIVLIEEDPADLKRISADTGIPESQISREWTEETGQ